MILSHSQLCRRSVRRQLDKNLSFHKTLAYMILLLNIGHVIAHFFNFRNLYDHFRDCASYMPNNTLSCTLQKLPSKPGGTWLNPIQFDDKVCLGFFAIFQILINSLNSKLIIPLFYIIVHIWARDILWAGGGWYYCLKLTPFWKWTCTAIWRIVDILFLFLLFRVSPFGFGLILQGVIPIAGWSGVVLTLVFIIMFSSATEFIR